MYKYINLLILKPSRILNVERSRSVTETYVLDIRKKNCKV